MQYTIKNEDIQYYNNTINYAFPKYTTQLINWANQNAQGTRPRVVGQMSDLIPEFMETGREKTIASWSEWYQKQYPDAIDTATDKIWDQMINLQEAIQKIDKNMVREWVKDLIFNKTFNGMYLQKAILLSLADRLHLPFRPSTPYEEAQGIDGYVGDTAYSVKPMTYKTMNRLQETIDARMIFYEKTSTGLRVEVSDY